MAVAYDKITGRTLSTGTANPAGEAASAPAASAGSAKKEEEKKKPTVKEAMQTYGQQNQTNIGKIYDASAAAQKQSLLNAYNTNTAAQNQQLQNTQQNYDEASQAIETQNAIGNRNLTQFANVHGVNTGAGSQHQLNLGNTAARANAAIDFQRQQALQEVDRQRQLMTTTYQNQVSAAIADNDYKKAAALLDDYQNNQKWQEQQAQILASYGNFDPYKQLYGDDAATAMQKVWQAQNPEVAYRTGAIDAETYKLITGEYPLGYSTGGGGEAWDTWWIPNPSSGPGNGNGGSIGGPGGGGGSSSTPYTLISSTFPWRK